MHASDAFERLDPTDTAQLVAWMQTRYGIAPACVAAHQFWRRPAGKAIWIAAAAFEPPPHLSCEALGVMVARKMPPGGKLTSVFLQRFGQSATRNVVRLQGDRLARFLRREAVFVGESPEGYQIVFAGERVLGAGFVTNGQLRSELPKAWAVT